MSQVQIQWDRIRRRWVLILVIGIVAAAGSLGASLLQGSSYTGRSALTIVSQDRAPEQDTVLAQGYADYFNQASSQQQLRQTAGVPSSVGLNARIAAASPIVYIEAVADSPDVASDSATKMAVALRDDVNTSLGGEAQQQQLTTLNQQLSAAQGAGNQAEASRLREEINDIQGRSTNQLQDLQLNAGVVSNPTNAGRNAGAALVGGLLLGALLAMALGRFENRIVTPSEVRDRLGLQVLAVVGGKRRSGENARNEMLRALMGLTNAHGMPVPGSLAITGPATARASKTRVAVALAGLRALQGQTTLLVQADLESDAGGSSELSSMSGVADFLAERGDSRIDGKVFSNGRALLVSPRGSKRDDLFALFSRSHVTRLLKQGSMLADLVIIDAPPAESVEGQVVCSAADRSLLVVEEGQTRSRDASAALESLARAGGTALGVVLVRNPGQLADPGFLAERSWTPARLPAGPPAGGPVPPPRPAQPPQPAQVPPADRTAPISREKLEETRAAMGVGPAEGANGAPVNGVAKPTNGAVRGGAAAQPTPGTNGSAAPRREEPSSADRPGAAGAAAAGAKPAPGAKPSPGGASSSGTNGAAQNGAPQNGAPQNGAPAKPHQGSAPQGAQSGQPGQGSTQAAPASKPAPTGKPDRPGQPQGGPAPKASSPQQAPGAPSAPAPGTPGTPGTEAPGVNVHTRRGSGAKPSPSPKPTPGGGPKPTGPQAGAGPSASGPSGPSGPRPANAPSAGSPKPAAKPTGKAESSSASPTSPPGAKRVGTARFSRSAAPAGSTAGSPGKDGDPKGADGELSAPTVTLRTEK
ncbi:hypothetical protein [Actinomycetospora aeridis]|uniref:Capsular polysaccharide biosynthesis protein n=1 Tax=Actinomycetospora aeridis TaxID=3129231 RepID=A0ABU8N709_9PSEU